MTTPLSRDLKLEEFSQLYQQIRSYEQGLVTVLNVCVVASTTLLSAIFAFFSNIYQTHPETVTVPFCNSSRPCISRDTEIFKNLRFGPGYWF